jgi:hypothetical protein
MKKIILLALLICMVMGLTGCNAGDVSQYIYDAGTFLRLVGNDNDWAVFVPSPSNPNWIVFGKMGPYGVYYWATITLESCAREIGNLRDLGWIYTSPNEMPGNIWVAMVGSVYAFYTAIGLSDIFFVIMPTMNYHPPVIIPDGNPLYPSYP